MTNPASGQIEALYEQQQAARDKIEYEAALFSKTCEDIKEQAQYFGKDHYAFLQGKKVFVNYWQGFSGHFCGYVAEIDEEFQTTIFGHPNTCSPHAYNATVCRQWPMDAIGKYTLSGDTLSMYLLVAGQVSKYDFERFIEPPEIHSLESVKSFTGLLEADEELVICHDTQAGNFYGIAFSPGHQDAHAFEYDHHGNLEKVKIIIKSRAKTGEHTIFSSRFIYGRAEPPSIGDWDPKTLEVTWHPIDENPEGKTGTDSCEIYEAEL